MPRSVGADRARSTPAGRGRGCRPSPPPNGLRPRLGDGKANQAEALVVIADGQDGAEAARHADKDRLLVPAATTAHPPRGVTWSRQRRVAHRLGVRVMRVRPLLRPSGVAPAVVGVGTPLPHVAQHVEHREPCFVCGRGAGPLAHGMHAPLAVLREPTQSRAPQTRSRRGGQRGGRSGRRRTAGRSWCSSWTCRPSARGESSTIRLADRRQARCRASGSSRTGEEGRVGGAHGVDSHLWRGKAAGLAQDTTSSMTQERLARGDRLRNASNTRGRRRRAGAAPTPRAPPRRPPRVDPRPQSAAARTACS